MSQDYEALLDVGYDELPDPVLLPIGSWALKGRNTFVIKNEDPTKNYIALVKFFYRATEPMKDVDDDELSAIDPGDYGTASLDPFTIFIEGNGDWKKKVVPHLEKHGITRGSVRSMLEAFTGTDVTAYLGVRTFKTKEGDEVTVNQPTSFMLAD